MIIKNNIIVFASGILGFKMLEYLDEIVKIDFISTDSKSDGIITFAKQSGIEIFIGKPNNEELYLKLKNKKSNILLSINYIFLLDKNIFRLFEYPINLHGSLLPKYRGRAPHIWAIINNEIETGITAHFIEEGCDEGDILFQKTIKIENHYTGADLLNIFQLEYPKIILKVLIMIRDNQIIRLPQDNSIATYYSKRLPQDGLLNWNWQLDRIQNWIRALSHPYPGAFTFYNNEKIIIDEIKFSNLGFDSSIENGTIISINTLKNPIVKIQNSALEITKIRNASPMFLMNKKFENEN